jgi:predicted Rdx family selenoprotein
MWGTGACPKKKIWGRDETGGFGIQRQLKVLVRNCSSHFAKHSLPA